MKNRRFILMAKLFFFGAVLLPFQSCTNQMQAANGLLSSTSSLDSAPQVTIEPLPEYINTPTIEISFEVRMSGKSTFKSAQCVLNQTDIIDCSQKKLTLREPADGSYILDITAETSSGVKSEPLRVQFKRDKTAPVIKISASPASVTSETSAQFSFSVTDNLSGVGKVECALDTLDYSACAGSAKYDSIPIGAHDFKIKATDLAGNTASASYSWTISETQPPPPIPVDFKFVMGMDLTAPPTGMPMPAVNVPYKDSAYKTTVTRLTTPSQVTDAPVPPWIRHEYSRRPAFNSNSTKALMLSGNGFFRLYNIDKTANKASFIKTLGLGEPQEPNWHPTNPDIVYVFPYYGEGMTISELNVQTNVTTQTRNLSTRVKSIFPQATQLWTKQEGRPSNDGKIWCMLAMKYDATAQVNVPYGLISYDYQLDQILGSLPITAMPDHISTSPSGKFCVPSWAYSPTLGTRAYALDFKSYKMLHTQSEHSDLALDKAGRDIFVFSDYDSGHVAMVDLESGARTNLFPLYLAGGTSAAMHISGIGSELKPGYVTIGFYGCTTNYGAAPCSYSSHWFNNKIVLVELAPSPKIYNLAHTHFGDAGYFAETQAVSNKDFSKVLFVSTWETEVESNISSYMIDVPISLLP